MPARLSTPFPRSSPWPLKRLVPRRALVPTGQPRTRLCDAWKPLNQPWWTTCRTGCPRMIGARYSHRAADMVTCEEMPGALLQPCMGAQLAKTLSQPDVTSRALLTAHRALRSCVSCVAVRKHRDGDSLAVNYYVACDRRDSAGRRQIHHAPVFIAPRGASNTHPRDLKRSSATTPISVQS